MTPKAAMIFAAGFGTRMLPLTRDIPKPMIEVAGRPMIDHAIDMVRSAGVERIVINTHYKADILAQHLGGRDVELVHESPEILETGGGLRNALPRLGDGPVFTVNADVVWSGPNPLSFARQHWNDHMDSLLVCIEPRNAVGTDSLGDFSLNDQARLTRGKGVIYAGVQIVRPERLFDIKADAFSLNALWDLHGESGRLFGCVYPGTWCDVGTPAGIPKAEALLRGEPDV